MKKRIIIVLVVVCMALFGSLAFAGDDWQDGFAKALDQNNLTGAMTLAYNSQASPQAVYEALEAFGVEQEEVGESIEKFIIATAPNKCTWYCLNCCNASLPLPDCCSEWEGPPNNCDCSKCN